MLGERCQVTTSLDGKGRLGLPAKLRHKLKENGINALVLTCVDGGIKAFSRDYWREHVEQPYAAKSPFDRGAQAYFYSVLADAEDASVDGQGRVRIPPRLREQASLEGRCVVISLMDWIEIWDPEQWELVQARARDAYDAERSSAP
ncbi:MAG: hypothetical protein GY913_04155 [Proteobacteria bacterium]|nr:hypothetical protein [Pseudomonadota bacterium]MCP4916096.1 hypothetical protein [Pseudomonadota bacterium]